MALNSHLLLLDLDGVVVLESGPPLCEQLEILALHSSIADQIARLDAPVVVLTHRSRAEARRILAAAGLQKPILSGLMAAEDLFLSGFRHRRVGRLLRGGLRKSLILPEVERRYGLKRDRMALIDDRIDNVEDMIGAGIGLVMHAPSAIGPDQKSIETFDFASALDVFRGWSREEQGGLVINLPPVMLSADVVRRTGLSTAPDADHFFNRARRIASVFRRRLTKTEA
ncbi:hypothetical protein [Methylocapsa palsarum]|uniref:Uncharacterized protein n=1 Tax=Methylocapsa palsarum TaxID=1612308 RepID=A0A1I4BJP5_9HYPH|nr:hypothetical protein [Methylocapsa palsarum]SFK68146.1 hypothetical protein SAMN05444581_1156 [Methylocapsa palsarum]